MYRPNRIGPWPLIDTDEGISTLDGPTWAAAATTNRLTPVLTKNGIIINEAHRADTFYTDQTSTLTTGEAVGVGVTIDGDPLPRRESQLSVAASGSWQADAAGIQVCAIIGRDTAAGSGDGVCARYHHVPFQTHVNNGADGGHISVNTSVVHGNFRASGSEGSENFLFGILFVNATAGSIILNDVLMSVSISRYIQDIDTFDPNR